MNKSEIAERAARLFHETYERLAPNFGYETRKESAVPWESVPDKNKQLMIAVCAEVLGAIAESRGQACPHLNRISGIEPDSPILCTDCDTYLPKTELGDGEPSSPLYSTDTGHTFPPNPPKLKLTFGEPSSAPPDGYAQWKQRYAPNDTGEDYDLLAAFHAGIVPDASGHWPDTYKKPNHPTFSTESIYAKGDHAAQAGRWEGETFTPATEQLCSPIPQRGTLQCLRDAINLIHSEANRSERGGDAKTCQHWRDVAAILSGNLLAETVRLESQSAPMCKAQRTGVGANDPIDCDWPFCGCDPKADKVIQAIEESGFKIVKFRSGAAQEVSPVGSVQKITGPQRPRCPVCGAETTCLSCKAGVEEVSPPSPHTSKMSDEQLQRVGMTRTAHERVSRSMNNLFDCADKWKIRAEKAEGDTRELKAALREVLTQLRTATSNWTDDDLNNLIIERAERLLGEPTKE